MVSDFDAIPYRPDLLVDVLLRNGVEFILIGGTAGITYGAQRATSDFDCVIQVSRGNWERVTKALNDLHARLRVAGLSDEESKELTPRIDRKLVEGMNSSHWRTDAGDLDLFQDIPGSNKTRLDYDALLGPSNTAHLGKRTFQVANLEQIVESKEATMRPKDIEAIRELRMLAVSARADSPNANRLARFSPSGPDFP